MIMSTSESKLCKVDLQVRDPGELILEFKPKSCLLENKKEPML